MVSRLVAALYADGCGHGAHVYDEHVRILENRGRRIIPCPGVRRMVGNGFVQKISYGRKEIKV